MRKIKIVADSAANVLELKEIPFGAAPMKVISPEREFVDDSQLNPDTLVDYFATWKGKSKTSCPSPADWLDAFGDGEDIFCVTITSNLSGSHNAACVAKELYEGEHPDRRVYVLDTLSAGPEMTLMVEKLEELALLGLPAEEIDGQIRRYLRNTGLLFMLESLKNFAANGRVSPAVAKIAGLLGIRIVGRASDKGQLEPLHKCPGETRALDAILARLQEAGLRRGKVRIAHCRNEAAAARLTQMLQKALPEVSVTTAACRGLCSYYAEQGGLLVGFEKQ